MFRYWKMKWVVVIVAALSSIFLVSQSYADADGQKYCDVKGGIVDRDSCWVQGSDRKYYKVQNNGRVTTAWSHTMDGKVVKDKLNPREAANV